MSQLPRTVSYQLLGSCPRFYWWWWPKASGESTSTGHNEEGLQEPSGMGHHLPSEFRSPDAR